MGTIILKNMEFYSYHGCSMEEQLNGTKFRVDIQIETDTCDAETSDDLNKTIDYLQIYNTVKTQMEIKSKLLENAARRIMNELINNFPEIHKAEVKISKLNPLPGGKISKAIFKLNYP
jgi:dihydroneopterin aldolase